MSGALIGISIANMGVMAGCLIGAALWLTPPRPPVALAVFISMNIVGAFLGALIVR